MRVIAGEMGGRRLVAPAGRGTRPTSDRVREALFSILGPVDDARVLDLFAGSGALGIEALSRGAAAVVAVENDRNAIRAIRANVDALSLGDRLRVVARGWQAAMKAEAAAGARYDLVLIDPPYDMVAGIAAGLGTGVAAVAAPGARVVLEHARGAMMWPDGLPGLGAERFETRRYGDTEITVMWMPGAGT